MDFYGTKKRRGEAVFTLKALEDLSGLSSPMKSLGRSRSAAEHVVSSGTDTARKHPQPERL